jgi:hypothetical protein
MSWPEAFNVSPSPASPSHSRIQVWSRRLRDGNEPGMSERSRKQWFATTKPPGASMRKRRTIASRRWLERAAGGTQFGRVLRRARRRLLQLDEQHVGLSAADVLAAVLLRCEPIDPARVQLDVAVLAELPTELPVELGFFPNCRGSSVVAGARISAWIGRLADQAAETASWAKEFRLSPTATASLVAIANTRVDSEPIRRCTRAKEHVHWGFVHMRCGELFASPAVAVAAARR